MITEKWLEKHDVCEKSIELFRERKKKFKTNKEIVKALFEEDYFDWGIWLLVKLLTKKKNLQLAIYCANLVLPIFEKRYPNDKRPRKAIQAAKKVVKNNTKKNREAAVAASYAVFYAYAANAANSSYAAYAAYAAYYAASYAVSYAANAANSYYAANAANAANAVNAMDIKNKIINYALRLL